MSAQGVVVLPGEGSVWDTAPGRSLVLKLLGGATGGSIMLFEETIPAGTKSWFHLHRDSDEVAYVLTGEITFKIGDEVTVGVAGSCAFMPRGVQHAWKNSGTETAKVLFLYTPAGAGGLLEEEQRAQNTRASRTEGESAELLQRYGWEVVGPNPL
jgi:quercetin dioxygenase-like cupin family protein